MACSPTFPARRTVSPYRALRLSQRRPSVFRRPGQTARGGLIPSGALRSPPPGHCGAFSLFGTQCRAARLNTLKRKNKPSRKILLGRLQKRALLGERDNLNPRVEVKLCNLTSILIWKEATIHFLAYDQPPSKATPQPRKGQRETNLNPKQSDMSHRDSPVTAVLPMVVIGGKQQRRNSV